MRTGGERQQAFFDAHMHAFAFYGGVFPILIYDNLTTAVQKVLRGRERLEQEGFHKFKAYYCFDARFCNRNSGHEKGGVEGLVGFTRRNYMVPVPEAASLEELNEKILRQCVAYGNHKITGRDRKVNELYEDEKEHLLSLPDAEFSNVQLCDGRADKYATVIVDSNRYSVPSRYAGFMVKALLYVDRIEIFTGTKKLTTHERLFGKNKWGLNPDHYLELIQQRPMAFNSARPIRQWRMGGQPPGVYRLEDQSMTLLLLCRTVIFECRFSTIKQIVCFGGENARRKPSRSGTVKETRSFETRSSVTIRLPQWMISQLKNKGEIGYLIEIQLAKKDFLDLPDDYKIGS